MSQQVRDAWAIAVAEAVDVLKRTGTRMGGPRQIADAALIGVCVLFIATSLGLPQLDAPLDNAITLFAVAIPLLVNGFLTASWLARGKRTLVAIEWLPLSAAVLDTVGETLVVIGLVAVLVHFGSFAAMAFVAAAILVFPATVLLAVLIGMGYARWQGSHDHERQVP